MILKIAEVDILSVLFKIIASKMKSKMKFYQQYLLTFH